MTVHNSDSGGGGHPNVTTAAAVVIKRGVDTATSSEASMIMAVEITSEPKAKEL